jgi:hypothetical protein
VSSNAQPPEDEGHGEAADPGVREAVDVHDGVAEDAAEADEDEGSDRHDAVQEGRGSWLVLLACLLLVELMVYGRRGHVQVCVGRQGEHDFALLGHERRDHNRHRFPSCERRYNLGVRSHFERARDAAALHACRRATLLRPQPVTVSCAAARDGWQHRIRAEHCPPWHEHFYKKLLWFAF